GSADGEPPPVPTLVRRTGAGRGGGGAPHLVMGRQVCPGLVSVVVPVTVVPFMVQMVGVPSVFCSRMADLLSPLSLPTPTGAELAPALPTVAGSRIEGPLSSHTPTSPVVVLCHRMSALPS